MLANERIYDWSRISMIGKGCLTLASLINSIRLSPYVCWAGAVSEIRPHRSTQDGSSTTVQLFISYRVR